MAKLFVDQDKYADGEGSPIVAAFNSALKDLVRRKLDESGGNWNDFVFGKAYSLITAEEVAKVERKVLDSGYRYTCSAMVSIMERPDAYKPLPGTESGAARFSFEHPDARTAPVDAGGREQRGQGDNVVKHPDNVIGTVRYYRSADQVMQSLKQGVPPGTIAIIDDSGGTLTAPILEQFKGVICAGGTVRSHLGILTREYGIPCLMGAKISGIFDGDTVELEVSGQSKTTEAYQKGVEMTVRVWKHAAKK